MLTSETNGSSLRLRMWRLGRRIVVRRARVSLRRAHPAAYQEKKCLETYRHGHQSHWERGRDATRDARISKIREGVPLSCIHPHFAMRVGSQLPKRCVAVMRAGCCFWLPVSSGAPARPTVDHGGSNGQSVAFITTGRPRCLRWGTVRSSSIHVQRPQ